MDDRFLTFHDHGSIAKHATRTGFPFHPMRRTAHGTPAVASVVGAGWRNKRAWRWPAAWLFVTQKKDAAHERGVEFIPDRSQWPLSSLSFLSSLGAGGAFRSCGCARGCGCGCARCCGCARGCGCARCCGCGCTRCCGCGCGAYRGCGAGRESSRGCWRCTGCGADLCAGAWRVSRCGAGALRAGCGIARGFSRCTG